MSDLEPCNITPTPLQLHTILKQNFNLDENISVAFAYHTFQLLILQIGFQREKSRWMINGMRETLCTYVCAYVFEL